MVSPSSTGGYPYSIHFAYAFTYGKCVLSEVQVAQIGWSERSKKSECYTPPDVLSSVFTVAELGFYSPGITG